MSRGAWGVVLLFCSGPPLPAQETETFEVRFKIGSIRGELTRAFSQAGAIALTPECREAFLKETGYDPVAELASGEWIVFPLSGCPIFPMAAPSPWMGIGQINGVAGQCGKDKRIGIFECRAVDGPTLLALTILHEMVHTLGCYGEKEEILSQKKATQVTEACKAGWNRLEDP